MHINPRASQVIKDSESPIIEYVNQFLNSATSVKAVSEAIKRYAYPVQQVIFINNSLRPKDACSLIDSIERHMPNLLVLNLSKNDIGVVGGQYIAKSLIQMRKLQTLILSECNITDRGLIEIIIGLEELGTVENLDLSGNQLGKSAHFA